MSNSVFPEKYRKKIPELIEVISSMNTEEIKKKILESEAHLYEIENAKEADDELAKAKEHAKELSASYRESKGIETAKIQYCLYVLEDRGINL